MRRCGRDEVPTRLRPRRWIGRGADLEVRSIPEDEVPGYFSFLAGFITLDDPTSNAITREVVGWQPQYPGLIADLDQRHYFA